MIYSVVYALKNIARNPMVLVPSIAAIAILFALLYAFAGFAIELIINAFFLEILPESPLNAFPFQFAAIYGMPLVALAALALIAAVLFTSLNYWFAAYIRMKTEKSNGFGKACSETISALGKTVGFVVFVALAAALAGIVLWAFALVETLVSPLGIILAALLALGCFYLYVKLVFTVPALALERGTVKQALEQSWNFSQGRFWQVLLFVIVVSVISQVVLWIGSSLSELVLDETVEMAILGIFWAVMLSFYGMAVPIYYAKNKLGKSV